jgi:glycosyltransferase involved in cell wall biosynthesis
MDISILVCVRDGERYLDEALVSAVAEQPAELIVIDDGSTDSSADIARKHGARVVSQPPRGIGPARIAAVAEARGDVVAFLDADDRFPPGRNAALLAPLVADDAADIAVGTMLQFISPDKADTLDASQMPSEPHLAMTPGGMLLRRQALIDHPMVADVGPDPVIEWLVRARERGAVVAKVDELVLERRLHGENYSATTGARAGYLDLARDAIARRRLT